MKFSYYFRPALIFLFVISLLTSFMLPNVSAETPKKDQCMQSWADGFTGVDRIFNEMIQKNLDSSKSLQIHPVDAIQMYSQMIGSYECQLYTVCAMVDQVAVKGETFASPSAGEPDRWQQPLSPPKPACGDFLSGLDANGNTVTTAATVRNALALFQISDDLQTCQKDSSGKAKLRPGQDCRQVAEVKVGIMSGKLEAALLYKTKREELGSPSAKLNDLTERIDGFSEDIETRLVDLAGKFFRVLGNVLEKIGCRISVTKQAKR